MRINYKGKQSGVAPAYSQCYLEVTDVSSDKVTVLTDLPSITGYPVVIEKPVINGKAIFDIAPILRDSMPDLSYSMTDEFEYDVIDTALLPVSGVSNPRKFVVQSGNSATNFNLTGIRAAENDTDTNKLNNFYDNNFNKVINPSHREVLYAYRGTTSVGGAVLTVELFMGILPLFVRDGSIDEYNIFVKPDGAADFGKYPILETLLPWRDSLITISPYQIGNENKGGEFRIVTEPKIHWLTIPVKVCDVENIDSRLFLRWFNSMGGLDFYLSEANFVTKTKGGENKGYKPSYTTTVERMPWFNHTISESDRTIKIGFKYVTEWEKKVLEGIIGSQRIEFLDYGKSQWRQVLLKDAEIEFQGNEKVGSVELILQLEDKKNTY